MAERTREAMHTCVHSVTHEPVPKLGGFVLTGGG
eukprot:COSAG02_NODE_102_length_36716_cov_233.851025_28_plen_34_part_00